jgi:hypothetical protein
MRSLIALSLVGAVCGPAWARPDHDQVPPGAFNRDVQMRMPVDGRGDSASHQMREARPEPWQRAERPSAPSTMDRAPTGATRADLPLKSEIAQKAHPGDHREINARPQALDARAQTVTPANDRMGRPEAKPALPIKIDVAMKAQHGDQLEPSSNGKAAKPADQSTAKAVASSQKSDKGVHESMSPDQKKMLCALAGVCLPQSIGSDDVEDKVE